MKRWIACLFLIACAATAEDTFSLYGKFQEALKQNDYPRALKLAEQMIQLCPGHSGVQYQYARALAVNGKSAEALQVLKRISQMGGSPPVQSEPVFDSLKQNPEFKQLLQTFEQNKTP